jgi:WD40 repeat protein
LPEPILRIEAGTHTARMADAAADAAGRVLVTASEDKTARIWSLPDLRPLGVLRPPIGPEQEGLLFAVAVSPDGYRAAVAGALGRPGAEKLVLLFDLRTREVVRTWAGPPNGTYSLAFSVDGTRLAAGFGGAHGISVWSVADGSEILRDKDYADVVYGVSFAQDGRLATTSFDHLVRLYDATGKLLRKVDLGSGLHLFRAAFSPDGGKLAVGGVRGGVQVLDGHTLALISRLGPYEMPDDRAGVMRMMTLLLNPANTIPFSQTRELAEVAWSRDGKQLFAGGDARIGANAMALTNTAALIWPTTSLRPSPSTGLGTGRIGPRAFIDTGSEDTTGRIIPLADNSIVTTSLSGHIALIGPDGHRRAVVTPDAPDFRDRDDFPEGIAVSGDGRRVAWSQWHSNGRWDIADTSGFGLCTATKRPEGLAGSYMENPTRNGRRTIFFEPWRWKDIGPQLNFEDYNLKPRALAIDPNERATSGAVLTDHVLLGTEWMLRLYDGTGNPIWSHHIPSTALRVNLAWGGQVAVAALGDGTVRWYRIRDGQELLALFLTRDAKRWVAFTPSAYYTVAPGAEDLIGWHVNRGPDEAADFFSVGRFRDRFYRPDVISRVLATLDEAEALQQADAARGTATRPAGPITDDFPPVVRILSPADSAQISATEATLDYTIRSPSGKPIEALTLLIDGQRPAFAPVPDLPVVTGKDQETRGRLSVPVPAGRTVEIALLGSTTRNGEAARVRVTSTVPAVNIGLPRLNGVLAGVANYPRESMRLKFAAKDARDVAAEFEKQRQRGRYRDVALRLVEEKDATRRGILTELRGLRERNTADDVALVFLSGHGVQSGRRTFFLPIDGDPDDLDSTAISKADLMDILSDIRGKVLVFLDICHAGAFQVAGKARSTVDMTLLLNEFRESGGGLVVFASSIGSEQSEELPQGNGAFTAALVEGLRGAAAKGRQGIISTDDLNAFVTYRVGELTHGNQHAVMLRPADMPDFPVITLAV